MPAIVSPLRNPTACALLSGLLLVLCFPRASFSLLALVALAPLVASVCLPRSRLRVFFLGYLTGDELSTVYASSDVFVFPSTTDTYGNVVLEAQASGLPVVVSNIGGPKEIIRRDVSGFVTNVETTGEFITHVHALVDSPGLRESMGREGRSLAEQRTWKRAMERFWQWRHEM